MAEAQKQGSGALEGVTFAGGDFAALLNKEFKPKTDEARSAVEAAVQTLAQQALSQTTLIGRDVVESIQSMIAAIDKKLSEQVNLILHHPEFQKLEGAWRGLHYMVNNTETDQHLKIRVMDMPKSDLAKTLKDRGVKNVILNFDETTPISVFFKFFDACEDAGVPISVRTSKIGGTPPGP